MSTQQLSQVKQSFAPQAVNPFGQPQQRVGALAQTDQSRAIAEIQAAILTARMNPRDPMVAMDRILNACTRPTLANSAIYTYARGGTNISGPSIRLAEAIAQNWGNIQFGFRELEQTNNESTVQAYAWDVETNVRREVSFQVPHIRYTRKGTTKLEDPRDIYELISNQAQRRVRACILATIPGDVVEEAVKQCETTMVASADTSQEGIKKLLEAFSEYDVTKEHIEKRIQRNITAIYPAQVVELRKIYASLRDGMSKASDWFDFGADLSALKKSANAHIDMQTGEITHSQPTYVPQQTKQAETIVTEAEPVKTEAPKKSKAPTYAQVADKLAKAKDIDVLDADADMIRQVEDKTQQTELNGIYRRKREELEGNKQPSSGSFDGSGFNME